MKFNRDCKSFPGVYACEIMKTEGYEDCSDCMFYEPIDKKIILPPAFREKTIRYFAVTESDHKPDSLPFNW